jgi:hypothetical protein
MTKLIKIVIPDAGPINTLAAAGLLDLLLAPKNTELMVIKSVLNEILVRSPEFEDFLFRNSTRIKTIYTSVCKDDAAKILRGESIGKGRGDLAIADFILHFIDESLDNAPALVIFEDKKLGRLRELEQFSENTHFITTAAYLRKLAIEGLIGSFEEVWDQVVQGNSSPDPAIHREPNPMEIDAPARSGSSIFRPRG